MVTHILKSLVQLRLVPVVRYDSRLQVVRGKNRRHSAKMLKTHSDGKDEVLALL